MSNYRGDFEVNAAAASRPVDESIRGGEQADAAAEPAAPRHGAHRGPAGTHLRPTWPLLTAQNVPTLKSAASDVHNGPKRCGVTLDQRTWRKRTNGSATSECTKKCDVITARKLALPTTRYFRCQGVFSIASEEEPEEAWGRTHTRALDEPGRSAGHPVSVY